MHDNYVQSPVKGKERGGEGVLFLCPFTVSCCKSSTRTCRSSDITINCVQESLHYIDCF